MKVCISNTFTYFHESIPRTVNMMFGFSRGMFENKIRYSGRLPLVRMLHIRENASNIINGHIL